jgi:hypothetical protein
MLIENKGIETVIFKVAPFELNEGELVVLNLSNGRHFYETALFLKDLFCGKTKDKNVLVHENLTFVEHFIEPEMRRLFYPTTVGKYLNNNANLDSPFATRIYEIEWIDKKTKVNTLNGSKKRLLNLYATLSKTNNIVFNFVGQDPKGVEEAYEVVKEVVKKGGSALLLDSSKKLKYDCTTYIELQWK